jgi:hypothetical protein
MERLLTSEHRGNRITIIDATDAYIASWYNRGSFLP